MTKARYQNLDAIRFFAFFKVFILHLPAGDNTFIFNFMKQGGGTGVAIFFVLSGFLISDILIKQKISAGKVNGFRFFWRRALRIYPLYFLGAGLAYAGIFATSFLGISESTGYQPKPFFSLLFLENYKMIWEGTHPRGAPLHVFWSLCIEEHFYLLWLLVFLIVPIRNIVKTFGILWILGITGRIISLLLFPNYQINGSELITSLDYFAAGGLVAASVNGLFPILNKTVRYPVKLLILCTATLYLLFQHIWFEHLGILGITLAACVYAMCIWACVMQGTNRLVVSEQSVWSKLGQISYGLYVFHSPVILVLLKVFEKLAFDYKTSLGIGIFTLLALALSVLAAWLSYRFIESPFLRLREKWF